MDTNEPAPVICPASPCPATYPTSTVSGTLSDGIGRAGRHVSTCPPPARDGSQPATSLWAGTWTWFSLGDSSYNALQMDVNHRFSHGLSLRGVYTWSKALDDGDSLNRTTANNAPALVSNPFNLRADRGPGDIQREERSRHQRRLRTAFRARESVCERLGRLGRPLVERLVGEQHRDRCNPDFRLLRNWATTRREMATRKIPCGRSSIRASAARWLTPWLRQDAA